MLFFARVQEGSDVRWNVSGLLQLKLLLISWGRHFHALAFYRGLQRGPPKPPESQHKETNKHLGMVLSLPKFASSLFTASGPGEKGHL